MSTASITKIAAGLKNNGFSILGDLNDFSITQWDVAAGKEVIGELNFSFYSNLYYFTTHCDEDGEEFVNESDIDNIIEYALNSDYGTILESEVRGSILKMWTTHENEIIFTVNGTTRCFFDGHPKDITRNGQIIREALRLFKALKKPGVWCFPEDGDGYCDRRSTFFQKIGFTLQANGKMVII